jgi:hypothetical protein
MKQGSSFRAVIAVARFAARGVPTSCTAEQACLKTTGGSRAVTRPTAYLREVLRHTAFLINWLFNLLKPSGNFTYHQV